MNGEKLRERVEAIIYSPKTKKVLMGESSFGKMMFPGGGIDQGESPEDAAGREALEEAGLTSSAFTSIHKPNTSKEKFSKDGKDYDGARTHFVLGRLSKKDSSLYNEEGDGMSKLQFLDIDKAIKLVKDQSKNEDKKYRSINNDRVKALKEVKRKITPFTKGASAAAKTAVVIGGNPNFIRDEEGNFTPAAKQYYDQIKSIVEESGLNYEFDPGEEFTTPRKDDDVAAWIAHSRGGGRLRFAPDHIKRIGVNASQGLSGDNVSLVNNPDDKSVLEDSVAHAKKNKEMFSDPNWRDSWTPAPIGDPHFTITDDGKTQLAKLLKESL